MYRIFLVEDSPVIRENLVDHLEESLPAKVVGWAPNENDSVSWLQANPVGWDLAVVDLFLTEGNGLGVLQSCKERRAHQKMVVLTNYATNDIRERCLKDGADAVFDKSQELDEFLHFTLSSLSRVSANDEHSVCQKCDVGG